MVLGTLISHPEFLNRDTLYELRRIVARYPYFQAARMLMLRNLYLLHDSDFGSELRRSILYISDRRALCRFIEGYTDKVVDDESEMLERLSIDRTMSLIDAFLDTLPGEHIGESFVVAETVGDYASMFLSTADSNISPEPNIQEADSVSRALELMSGASRAESVENGELSDQSNQSVAEISEGLSDSEESLDESCFTETLAKIYIKQHKYSRALEIIRSLYLQFPEKNAYFADQIRFLEKLIINNNLK